MSKPKVYIAGKVTGLPEKEVRVKFGTAARIIRDISMIPINPIELVNDANAHWIAAMRKCIAALMTVDAVYALSDSGKSRGAKIELFLCRVLHIPVFRKYDDLLKYFKVYPVDMCGHPLERHRERTKHCIVNVETIEECCLDCGAVLDTWQEV